MSHPVGLRHDPASVAHSMAKKREKSEMRKARNIPTASNSIRRYCLGCSGESALYVRDCRTVDCPLWIFRMGHEANENECKVAIINHLGEVTGHEAPPVAPKRQPRTKAIRARCLDCAGEGPSCVTSCRVPQCALWPYRMGRPPRIDDLTEGVAKHIKTDGGV